MANNLDALDLELSQTNRLYELVEKERQLNSKYIGDIAGMEQSVTSSKIGGQMMESLDLNTGYHGAVKRKGGHQTALQRLA